MNINTGVKLKLASEIISGCFPHLPVPGSRDPQSDKVKLVFTDWALAPILWI